jgi:hypothetical protein
LNTHEAERARARPALFPETYQAVAGLASSQFVGLASASEILCRFVAPSLGRPIPPNPQKNLLGKNRPAGPLHVKPPLALMARAMSAVLAVRSGAS